MGAPLRLLVLVVAFTLASVPPSGGEGQATSHGYGSRGRVPAVHAHGGIPKGCNSSERDCRSSSVFQLPRSGPCALFCLAIDAGELLRLRGGGPKPKQKAPVGKKGMAQGKPAGRGVSRPKRPAQGPPGSADQPVMDDEDVSIGDDGLEDEIGALTAGLEEELGDFEAAAGAARAAVTPRRSSATGKDPTVKQAVLGIDVKLRKSGKTEEELAQVSTQDTWSHLQTPSTPHPPRVA